jgi:hypothetical protein
MHDFLSYTAVGVLIAGSVYAAVTLLRVMLSPKPKAGPFAPPQENNPVDPDVVRFMQEYKP